MLVHYSRVWSSTADTTFIDEVQKRYSFFYLIGCVASALSGILAYGFSQMAPLQGLNGWQWIFIMQGVVC
jgi:hypothetical protein